MSDRLSELLRQRALVQQHLAWLDGEIADASGNQAPSPHAPATFAPPKPAAPHLPASSPGYLASQAAAIALHASSGAPAPTLVVDESPRVTAAADAILDKYRVPPDALKTDVRKGCFLYFFVALAALGAAVTALYFLLHRGD
jgi:hypothetical protein